MNTFLKHPNGQTFARISTDPQGRQWISANTGSTLGYYDPVTNITKRTNGTVVARGNALTLLLPSC